MQPRGWWKVDAKRTNTLGVEASFDLIRDVLHKDHYDVSALLVFGRVKLIMTLWLPRAYSDSGEYPYCRKTITVLMKN